MKKKRKDAIDTQLALPFQETNYNHLEDIFYELEVQFGLIKNSNQKLIDLGSGNGRVIFFSALNYGIKSVGIEINAHLVRESKDNLKKIKEEQKSSKRFLKKIKILYGDLFEQNISDYDFVYMFSLPTFHKFLKSLLKTCKDEVIIISYKYPIKDMLEIFDLKNKIFSYSNSDKITTYFYRKRKNVQ